MRTRNAFVAAALILLFGVSHAEASNIGQALSSDFLSRLMLARASRSEIAVIHEQVGSAMLINAEDPSKAVVYLRGRTFLWSQIADQLSAASGSDKPMRLELERWTLEVKSCAALDRKLEGFLKRVEEALTHLHTSSTDANEIWLDAASFRIQLAANDGWLVIIPKGSSNLSLQQATGELHSVVSGCSNSVQPSVEQHDF